jgi:hypothetical protein
MEWEEEKLEEQSKSMGLISKNKVINILWIEETQNANGDTWLKTNTSLTTQ